MFASHFQKMGYRYIQKVVREFQGGLVRDHYKDLKYTCLILFNKIVDGLRKGNLGGISFVDTVLEASNIIEETTLMREQIKSDEAAFKRDMIYWYLEDDLEKMTYRIPSKVDTFDRFRDKKSNKAKDYAIEIVTKNMIQS